MSQIDLNRPVGELTSSRHIMPICGPNFRGSSYTDRQVAEVHGEQHAELHDVKCVFRGLQAELMLHMMKEEQVLFPAIRQLDVASQPLSFPFGTVRNPIRMMEHEHDTAGNSLRQLRSLTNDYTAPESACNTYRAMLDGLCALELDLHEHIHKENNILFPRAAKLEASRG